MHGQRARPAGILASSRTNQDLALRLPLSLSLSLSLSISLYSPSLPFLSSLSLPSSTQKLQVLLFVSSNLHILIIIFLFYFSSLFQHLLFFLFLLFFCPPFFLIFFPSNFLLCPAPDLHRPTLYPPQAVLEILRCVSWWPQSSIALYLSG